MKKIFFLLAMMCCATMVMAQNRSDFANYGRYAQDNKTIGVAAPGENRIVFLGNSIVEFWMNMRPEFFRQHGYISRGISGQTSHHFLSRFREDVIKLKPSIVVIGCGTNDVAENLGSYVEELTVDNIISMVELAKYNGIKVIITSVLPSNHFFWRPEVTDGSQKIQALNARLQSYCAQNGITYVDYYSAMVDRSDNNGLSKKYSDDGVHPNAAGYQVMEGIIVPVLENVSRGQDPVTFYK